MTTTGIPDPQDSVSPAAVYLLQRHDGQRFKIGWAVEPMARVKRLPEFMADELDLRASHAAWLPSPTRARQIEHEDSGQMSLRIVNRPALITGKFPDLLGCVDCDEPDIRFRDR